MDPRSSKQLEDIPDALSQGLQANDRDTSGRPSKNSRNSQPVPTSALSKTDAIKSPRAALHQVPRDSLLVNGTDSLDRYFMGHENRGLAIIINNKSFHKDLKLSERHGTDVDATALEDAFKTLGFTSGNILRYDDVPSKAMVRLMEHYGSSEDFSNMDCFFCVILSHGNDGAIYAHDGKTTLEALMNAFKKRMHHGLLGKPKIFLIQACRGDKLDHGRDLLAVDNDHVQRIPLEADFLYAYSTVPGYFSWRNAGKGSWFIQAFVKNVKKHKRNTNMDLVRLLTRVNHDVAYYFQSHVPDDSKMHSKKQMPSIVSMLTKDLYFHHE